MRFVPTAIAGVTIVETEPRLDGRGAFARLYCPLEFAAAGLGDFRPAQVNLSRNTARHTLRGLHYQDPPRAEAKLVRVTRGRIFDVAVDLRPGSPTLYRWTGTVLDEDGLRALFIPEGCAHGFITLAPETDVLYQMGRNFEPGWGRGLRYDDPRLAIAWPAVPAVVDDKDRNWPLLGADV
ncbi:dTDP-4-dehydrorhamnose 3,5-epimerase family protein [Zavarzinia compransoris]|uniref:dTDP-4-dehydrorhamnose 3,5-epimerase n=1 Tax=Zavarzinia compransoris TaxID=1264899 RepID=A0A317E1F7_9PROT|nr:dTDP-4-dehydrorhamnose 3,5-epimerase family protein [Zavarzinia compransoris]PWR20799.1 dTDP-4-dehydrorhamnose 3,5-epimerase [Zavarzinia compransoris]TDP44366.1 dTDP-4-dehydrorhamnose 3,5-epimerase [Zavarzinia compransoris]